MRRENPFCESAASQPASEPAAGAASVSFVVVGGWCSAPENVKLGLGFYPLSLHIFHPETLTTSTALGAWPLALRFGG